MISWPNEETSRQISKSFERLNKKRKEGSFFIDRPVMMQRPSEHDPEHKSPADDLVEPISVKDNERFILFPIKHQDIWDNYEEQQGRDWKAEEVNYSQDPASWALMNENEQHYVINTLAFFANSDNAVIENLFDHIMREIAYPEAIIALTFQAKQEGVHVQAYSHQIMVLVKDPVERQQLLRSVENNPIVGPKFNWMKQWIDRDNVRLAHRLVAWAFIEGVFFSSSFASLFWVRAQGKLPGVCVANEWISLDEELHVQLSALLYKNHIVHKLSQQEVYDICTEVTNLEKRFVRDCLPVSLIGLDADRMCTYVEFCADKVLHLLGYPSLYGVMHNLTFLNRSGLPGHTNFFERVTTEYSKEGLEGGDLRKTEIDDEEEF